MSTSRHEGDHYFAGNVSMLSMTAPEGSIAAAAIAALAGIQASKLQHQHQQIYAQPNTAATSATEAVHVVYGATGTILAFKVGSIAAAIGNSTVTVDLKKNGATVLTGVVTLDNANVARVVESGTLSVTALVAGDLLEVVTVATIGTGTLATGVYAEVILTEAAQ